MNSRSGGGGDAGGGVILMLGMIVMSVAIIPIVISLAVGIPQMAKLEREELLIQLPVVVMLLVELVVEVEVVVGVVVAVVIDEVVKLLNFFRASSVYF